MRMQQVVTLAWACPRANLQLCAQQTEAAKLDAAIAANLKGLGYGG